jgi:hypothetical protein
MKIIWTIRHSGVTSGAGPAVAALPRNGGLALAYAWRGNNNSRNLADFFPKGG